MVYTYEASKQGYANLWRKAEVVKTKEAARVALGILKDQERYKIVAEAIGHPGIWPLIGAIHYRESSRDFSTQLAQGDPLNQVSTHVPKGLGPYDRWEEAAVDILKIKGWDKIEEFPLELWLYKTEAYNGWGYQLHGVNSAYIWAGTTLQQPGFYPSDGKWSATANDPRVGVVAILKAIFDYEPELLPLSDVMPSKPAPIDANVDVKQVMDEVINIVLPFIEQKYVVLTKAQFAALVKGK